VKQEKPKGLTKTKGLTRKTQPCAICGLAPQIPLANGSFGRVCLFYDTRISGDELSETSRGIRKACLDDGDHFAWPLRGVRPTELLAWRMTHNDWWLQRLNAKAASAGVAVTTLGAVLGFVLGALL
jgi:hypothetical protein